MMQLILWAARLVLKIFEGDLRYFKVFIVRFAGCITTRWLLCDGLPAHFKVTRLRQNTVQLHTDVCLC